MKAMHLSFVPNVSSLQRDIPEAQHHLLTAFPFLSWSGLVQNVCGTSFWEWLSLDVLCGVCKQLAESGYTQSEYGPLIHKHSRVLWMILFQRSLIIHLHLSKINEKLLTYKQKQLQTCYLSSIYTPLQHNLLQENSHIC